MIELKPIKHNNWMECIGLEVHDDQKGFVNPNIFFLAEAYAHSDANKDDAEKYYRCIPMAIYNDDKMVGFVVLTFENECDFDDTPGYEIYGLMIAKDYQKNGYGKEAVEKAIDYLKTFPYGKAEYVYTSWHPDNSASEKTFTSCGFRVVGTDEDDGAIRARLCLTN